MRWWWATDWTWTPTRVPGQTVHSMDTRCPKQWPTKDKKRNCAEDDKTHSGSHVSTRWTLVLKLVNKNSRWDEWEREEVIDSPKSQSTQSCELAESDLASIFGPLASLCIHSHSICHSQWKCDKSQLEPFSGVEESGTRRRWQPEQLGPWHCASASAC